MKAPIIIAEDFDISIHPSVKHAASHLEVWDVEDNIYLAYDSEGQCLNLFVDTVESTRQFLWIKWKEYGKIVCIEEFDTKKYNLPDLRERLKKYLRIPDIELMEMSTLDLITKVGLYMPWRL